MKAVLVWVVDLISVNNIVVKHVLNALFIFQCFYFKNAESLYFIMLNINFQSVAVMLL